MNNKDFWDCGILQDIGSDYDPTVEESLLHEHHTPNKSLWLAVIYTGLEDLGIVKKKETITKMTTMEEWQEASDWFLDRDHSNDFENVCFFADESPSRILSIVKKYKCPCHSINVINRPCPTYIKVV